MKLLLLAVLILLNFFVLAQIKSKSTYRKPPLEKFKTKIANTQNRLQTLSCNNWLSTPTQPSYVNLGNLNITGNKISIEAVINRTSFLSNGVSTEGDIVSKHSGPPDVNYILRPTRALITTTTGFYLTPDACPLQLNKTYHIAMVYDGTTLKYYRNGFLMSQVAATGNLIQNNWNTFIGYYAPQSLNENFIGYINEVRIWNVARTQADIRTYMDGSLPNPTTQSGLLAYYTFDNLLNKQGNATWNGTLGGNATINAVNPNCTFVADSCAVPETGTSNIINSYTPVINLLPCENKLTVEDGSSFNTGDTVLIIQMKGALIDTSNTAAFGTVNNYGNAGNYESNYVKSKSGNVIELKNNLTRQYTLPMGKVQLIRVPYYFSTSVSSTLTCLPWDGSKGGVLVFNVRDTLSLNANIDVTGKGFSGGRGHGPQTSQLVCNNTDYYFPANSVQAASKGESIYAVGSTKLFGRGNNASGAGGGNGHNAGGGGGGNGGTGGFGGYQLDWCGSAPFDNRGIGGRPLTYNNALNKTFLGGGGGSGHMDNSVDWDMDGGNGGGIVIINSGFIKPNTYKIISKGQDVINCPPAISNCHDAVGGGGAGGTVMLQCSNYLNAGSIDVTGGKGGNLVVFTPAAGKLGPGGGGSGGVIWYSTGAGNPLLSEIKTGGLNGVITLNANDPWGATAGQSGVSVYGLKLVYDTSLYQKNIDSVRIKDSLVNCSTIDFKGNAFFRLAAITSWQWTFGDGGTAATQNALHPYQTSGNFLVKLIVTDANGCKDSITKIVNISGANISDFSFQMDPCNPLFVQFVSNASAPVNNYWSFGDGATLQNNQNPLHIFSSPGNYIIRYTNPSGNCVDTITKIISLGVTYQNIILTADTTICFSTSKQLLTVPSNSFCWSPATYLNNPLLANPLTNTPQNIIYYFTSIVTGNNLITNGNFSQGNASFTSAYNYAAANTASGQYFIGANAGTWLGGGIMCSSDHTTGTGNMLMANGSNTVGSTIWSQTIPVIPNTNYELSGWLAGLSVVNPSVVQFTVNGLKLGNVATAISNTCQWNRFSTIWNSGLQTSIQLAVINVSAQNAGNDFALDDLAFAPVFIRRDSVAITIDTPRVRAGNDTAICRNDTLRLQASGASSYNWTPANSLSGSGSNSPLAFPTLTTQYIVSGSSINGCTAKDTIIIQVKPAPLISALTADTTICRNASLQLNASGGITYSWQPANTLNNPLISNPVASPDSATTYYVTVTGANSCSAKDSVKIRIAPPPNFRVDPEVSTCLKSDVQLHAYGGSNYQWSPSAGLSATNISNPFASPSANTIYTVNITDNICNNSALLTVVANVLPLPVLQVNKSNDIDCSVGTARLVANGANGYRWSPGNTLSDSTSAQPNAFPSITTLYTVTGRSLNGCENVDTVTVLVKFEGSGVHYLPNAFTPNGDGMNECFGVKNWGEISNLNFAIYNRWGERVFYTTNPAICWDGRYKNELQQSGNFIYIIQAKTPCGAVDMKGNVLLIR